MYSAWYLFTKSHSVLRCIFNWASIVFVEYSIRRSLSHPNYWTKKRKITWQLLVFWYSRTHWSHFVPDMPLCRSVHSYKFAIFFCISFIIFVCCLIDIPSLVIIFTCSLLKLFVFLEWLLNLEEIFFKKFLSNSFLQICCILIRLPRCW